MICSLRNFFSSESGTYVGVDYTVLSCSLLYRWSELQQVPNRVNEDDLHTSVLYSRVKVPREHHVNLGRGQLEGRDWKFTPSGFKIFSTEEKTRALVMTIDAPQLELLHEQLRAAGGTHDFPSYQPHVTLSYDVPESLDPDTLTPPPIYMVPRIVYTRALSL